MLHYYFYTNWKEGLPYITSMQGFWDAAPKFLAMIKLALGQHTLLLARLMRIAHLHWQTLAASRDETHKEGWKYLLLEYLIPAISTQPISKDLGHALWLVLKDMPWQDRFTIYGEWYRRYETMPELKKEFLKPKVGVRALIKSVTQRIAGENVKTQGRALTKLSHTNPLMVIKGMYSLMSMYESFIAVNLDVTKYFSPMSYDCLTYLLMWQFTEDKDQMKEGAGFSTWLSRRFFLAFFDRQYGLNARHRSGDLCWPIVQAP